MFSVRASLRRPGDHSAGGARCDSPGLAGVGGKSSPARAQEARTNAKAEQAQRGPSWRAMQSPQAGFAQTEICSQPNQSAISGSFFGTKYWKSAESDDGNPKKSMILHRMVPSDSAKSVLIDLPVPPRPKQRVLAPLQDAEGAARCRRPRPERDPPIPTVGTSYIL